MTTAILDACILYSAPLRDLFMRLAVHLLFQPKWTERIHAEWIDNVLNADPTLSGCAWSALGDSWIVEVGTGAFQSTRR